MTRTAEEVEREVEASRQELNEDVQALKQKMTPGQLFDEAGRTLGGAGQQIAQRFVEQAKENPMPVAVIGLGLAWLMMSSNRRPAPGQPSLAAELRSFAPESAPPPAGTTPADKAHEMMGKASGLAANAREKLAAAKSSVGESGRSAAHRLGSAAGSVASQASHAGQKAQQTFRDSFESEPLLIGALGLVVGAAIGAALPASAAEDRLMGEARDRILRQGKELAESGMRKAGSATQAAYGGVKSALQHPEGELEEKAESAGRAAVQGARDQLQGPAH